MSTLFSLCKKKWEGKTKEFLYTVLYDSFLNVSNYFKLGFLAISATMWQINYGIHDPHCHDNRGVWADPEDNAAKS